ncbi:MAG: type II toxin-antitoxin system RatA family toxin [Xanthomonadales bacterium]|nr:type II toxin-antitoxin system RatA family toxin [Xanthomonadales bacterium]MCB1643617.1 type II toxin-antitoxin system RatA family toxin [Xanthomonadales bacterium]
MPQVHRSALVPRSASLMYGLVNDVLSYPDWFDWCDGAEVLEAGADSMVARLRLRLGPLRTGFTTRNRLLPDERIELELVDGPLNRLSGSWGFRSLGEGCKVALDLNFDYRAGLLDGAFRLGFERLANQLVDDFVRVARRVD